MVGKIGKDRMRMERIGKDGRTVGKLERTE
jgi:hypothetical protein